MLKNQLEGENVYLQEEIRRDHHFEEIVGSSPPLLELFGQLEFVGATDLSVLIHGERRTAARYTGQADARAQGTGVRAGRLEPHDAC